jgi:hypothetical protein
MHSSRDGIKEDLTRISAEFRDYQRATARELKEKDQEICRLQGVILGLKQDISRGTKIETQLSDDIVSERWERISCELMNWCQKSKAKVGMLLVIMC